MRKIFVFGLAITLAGLVVSSFRISSKTITGTITDAATGEAIVGATVYIKAKGTGTSTDIEGKYKLLNVEANDVITYSFIGYENQTVRVADTTSVINIKMKEREESLQEVTIETSRTQNTEAPVLKDRKKSNNVQDAISLQQMERAQSINAAQALRNIPGVSIKNSRKISIRERRDRNPLSDGTNTNKGSKPKDEKEEDYNTEEYKAIEENRFLAVTKEPLSTFSIDVDRASYSNIRRYINVGQMPPKDAIRLEEMVNYFSYTYEQPTGEHPFSIYTEVAECPWNKNHQLVHIGLQGKNIPTENLPPSNLVFLIDVSGSMTDANKLPLVKSAMRLLVNNLRPQDKVAMVVYAGAAGLVLPPTNGKDKEKILQALDNLEAGGSTAGGAGLRLAYKIAEENLMPNGNNRVILATDGDFNVGVSSDAEMQRLVEEKRKTGVFMTVLGFGMGNYKDSKMETIADKGNGNYAYIDNIQEAHKVFVKEFGGTLFTIAKDVKLQIEFNPTQVKAYRLIGYENRALANEDFNDDKKDAGELGSGHTVTALYEIIPAGSEEKVDGVDELKYQKQQIAPKAYESGEVMTLKFRYKHPKEDKSKLIEKVLKNQKTNSASENFRWACAVIEFGLILRDSQYKGKADLDQVIALAESARGTDPEGYRAEFIRLVRSCQVLAKK